MLQNISMLSVTKWLGSKNKLTGMYDVAIIRHGMALVCISINVLLFKVAQYFRTVGILAYIRHLQNGS
jgi:hypothetical protein